jgi:hypothetical protein
MAEVDPFGIAAKAPGSKLDAGKAPIMRGLLHYFPRALKAVSEVSLIGANKYSWKGWEKVPEGEYRYGDALGRHIIYEEIEGPYDNGPGGTGALHASQIAWNALARLELMLRRLESEGSYEENIPCGAD